MNKSERVRRLSWSVLLLALPLFSYPLAWNLVLGRSVPELDLIHPVTLSVIALAALAAAAAEPRRILKAWRSSPLLRTFFVSGLLCVAAAAFQQLLYGGSWENFFYALFAVTLPWAGVALAPELKRLLPWWCSGLFVLLLVTTVRTPMCIGFVGNWNWNFTLLALTLAALVVLVFRSRWRLAAAGAAVSLGVVAVFICFPEFAPRGTLAGVIGAAVSLALILLFKRRERWRYALLAALASGALFISAVNTSQSSALGSSRVQLWRGGLEFALAHTVVGVGPARFESRIPPYLPPEYFLSDFPAVRHPHPHNELLYLWAGFGLAGIFYFLMCIAVSVRQISSRDPAGLWIMWSFLLLLIHGMFDVHLATPLAGTLCFLMLGTICGGGFSGSSCPVAPPRRYAAALVLLAGALILAGLHYRAGDALREGRLAQGRNDKAAALQFFRRSVEIWPTAPALYMAGQVEFFDFHRPEYALFWWSRIQDELRMPSFLHLNRFMGHACDVMGRYPLAFYYFEKESRDFPFSAINAGLKLGLLQKIKAPPEQLQEAAAAFNRCMQMRNLPPGDFPKLLRDPRLDDGSLVNPK